MESRTLPISLALGSAILWGVWWWPLMWLHDIGIPGLWAAVAMSAGAIPICLMLSPFWREKAVPARPAIGAVFAGAAVTLYSSAVVETSVIRAVLLFYLAPAWAIAIECLFFGRRFRALNVLTFVFAALGFLFIFRFQIDCSALNLGDAMALISGLSWAVGTALIFSGKPASAPKLCLITALSGVVIGLIIVAGFETVAPPEINMGTIWPTFVAGSIYLAPLIIATLWAARFLPPATISFLLTAEVISGVASAAVFLGDPFGLFEATGALLIITAALTEVVSTRPKSAPSAVLE